MTYSNAEVVETSEDGRYRVILVPDEDCERPMDAGDGWVTSLLARNGRGLKWAAMHDPEGRLDALYHFDNMVRFDSISSPLTDGVDAFKRYMSIFHGIEVHDVEVTNGYRDTSSGLAWIEPSEAERVGLPYDRPASKWAEAIAAEIDEHNRWAEGDCYGYVVQKRVVWNADDDDYQPRESWEDTDDSCWGFIGSEYAEEEARSALNDVVTA